jgi:hypothetical protein
MYVPPFTPLHSHHFPSLSINSPSLSVTPHCSLSLFLLPIRNTQQARNTTQHTTPHNLQHHKYTKHHSLLSSTFFIYLPFLIGWVEKKAERLGGIHKKTYVLSFYYSSPSPFPLPLHFSSSSFPFLLPLPLLLMLQGGGKEIGRSRERKRARGAGSRRYVSPLLLSLASHSLLN